MYVVAVPSGGTEPAALLAVLASGAFFLTGLLTGVWKYRHIWESQDSKAPYYVNTAHRASLMYSFAALVLYHFVLYSPWSRTVDIVSVGAPVFFFGFAISTYILHGVLQDTDNQFEKPHVLGPLEVPPSVIRGSMWLLILAEIGGFGVLFAGFLARLV